VLDLYITHAANGVRSSQLERQRVRPMRYMRSELSTDEEVSAAETGRHREPKPRRIYSSKETPPDRAAPGLWLEQLRPPPRSRDRLAPRGSTRAGAESDGPLMAPSRTSALA
jgi:hypothetical protein